MALKLINYFGGDGQNWQWIVDHFPPHRVYVEVFGGGAAVLLNKPPSAIEVYNDIDERLYALFLVMSTPRLFEQFYERVALLPMSRRIHAEYSQAADGGSLDLLDTAIAYYVRQCQSFGGHHSWGLSVHSTQYGLSGCVGRWLGSIRRLPLIHARLYGVRVERLDFQHILERYDTTETLFYCDPPFPMHTRRHGGYLHEMTDDDHRRLVECLLGVKGSVVLKGYPTPLYSRLNGNWQMFTKRVPCSVVGRTRTSRLQGRGKVTAMQSRTLVLWRKTALELL